MPCWSSALLTPVCPKHTAWEGWERRGKERREGKRISVCVCGEGGGVKEGGAKESKEEKGRGERVLSAGTSPLKSHDLSTMGCLLPTW